MATADWVVVHDLNPQDGSPIRNVSPTVAGGQIVGEYGYVYRKRGFILMCLASEIEDTIANYETDGYTREGQPSISYTINPQLQFYDVEFNLIKYSPN